MITIPTGWTDGGVKISRLFVFSSFTEAMGFMAEIALYCEKANHHPEWKNIYNKVWVDLTTHDAGGVTEKDLALAAHMDATAKRILAATHG